MRHIPATVALVVLLTASLAAAPAAASAETADRDVEEVVELYNRNVEDAPDVVRNRFVDERVVVIVERAGGEDLAYTAVTDDSARIESIEEGAHDPTLRVTTDEQTVREVVQADDTATAAVDAYESDAVEVEGVGVTNTAKVEATKLGYEVASRLGLL